MVESKDGKIILFCLTLIIMKHLAIIGAGISGLSAAHFLKDKYDVTIFEKEDRPGGLIKFRRVNGNLFHTCGGHVSIPNVKMFLTGFGQSSCAMKSSQRQIEMHVFF